MRLNESFLRLPDADPTALLAKKAEDFQFANPDTVMIRLDCEDDPRSPVEPSLAAQKEAAEQILRDPALNRLPPRQGYPFLIEAIRSRYQKLGVTLSESEIFINDGAKCDITGLTELLDDDNTVLIAQPFNPIYYNSNLTSGRVVRFADPGPAGAPPLPDRGRADVIYLSNPMNPTGDVYSAQELKVWVDYALINEALIIFDASYADFARSPGTVKSIYQIENAAECAVEIRSLSKSAGFANARLGYTVIPNRAIFDGQKLNRLWTNRQRVRFNGVNYLTQYAAAAVFSDEGQAAVKARCDSYLENARILSAPLIRAGLTKEAQINAPYVWFDCPGGMSSWEFLDVMLKKCAVTALPGSIFGPLGEGRMKLSAYESRENAIIAAQRLEALRDD